MTLKTSPIHVLPFSNSKKNMKFLLVSKHLQENRPAVVGTKPTTKPETSEHAFDHALEGHDILLDNWDQDYERKTKKLQIQGEEFMHRFSRKNPEICIYIYVYSEIFGEFASETSITILGGRKKQISRHHRARLPSTNIYMYLVVSTHLKTLINWKSPPNRGENMFKKRHHHLGTYYKIHPPLHSPGVTVH